MSDVKIRRDAVIAMLTRAPPNGIRVGHLAAQLGVNKKGEYALRKLLGELIERGEVERVGRGSYALSEARAVSAAEPEPDAVVGRLSVHPAGYGFVALDDGTDTVFVPAKFRGSALDGDRVELNTWQGYKGVEGQVIKVLSRGRARLTGTLRSTGRALYLEPDDPRIATAYGFVPLLDGAPGGKAGLAAVVEITRYPTAAVPELAGRLLRMLGEPDDPRTEIEKILVCADIPEKFPRAAVARAERAPTELGPGDFADRIDLRDRPFMTIDPEDARDFDDALCIEDGPRGTTRVWIAIADVSHYVHTDDALDREAVVRGVSVYLPDRVVPMLPMQLSAGICSLKQDEDRCAMVVRLDFDDDGAIRDHAFAAAVIRSHARLDYPGVAAALSGDFRGRRMHYRRWAPALGRLDALAQVLRERRRVRGSLMLEIAEPKVLLDDDDPLLVRDVVRAKGTPGGDDDVRRAYQLVEEFMIAANEAVGEFFAARDLPTLWRIHAPPEATRLEELAAVLSSFGIKLDLERAATPTGMKEVLDAVGDTPLVRTLSYLVLRALKQAAYDTRSIGHFGLASPRYLHFTSPIRRFPDLIVHRLLKAALHAEGQASGGGASVTTPDRERLDELAQAVSTSERRAMDAEREAVAMYRAYLVREQVGEQFSGKISAVTNFGAFVELDEPFVEGLVKIDELGPELFVHDPVKMRLIGQKSGLKLTVGDTVLVELSNVSVPLRRIDLRLLSLDGKAIDTTSRRGRRKQAGKDKRSRRG